MNTPLIFSQATNEHRCAECYSIVVPTDDISPSLAQSHVCGSPDARRLT